MKFGIFSRSTAGYLIVLFLLGASNVYAIFKLAQFNTIIMQSLDADVNILDLEKRLVDSLFSQQRYEQKYLLTKDYVLYNQFLTSRDDFRRYVKGFHQPLPLPKVSASLKKILLDHQQYEALVDREVKYLHDKRRYDTISYRIEKEKTTDRIHDELEMLARYAHEDIYNKTKMIREAGFSARNVAVSSFTITVFLAVLLSFLITRSITKPLIELVSKTREIPMGVFDCTLTASAPPEIRELSDAFFLMCERLREVDKIKGDFFSMISHELKTPLTTIREGTSLLLEGAGGATSEKQGRLLTIIAAESERLTGLVNSILDLSKMEAGMITYNFGEGSIMPLIEQAMTEIVPYAEAKKIVLERKTAGDIPATRMDRERLLEVLRNLISNAVKFAPGGGRVTVTVTPVPDGLEVVVSDTGPGIPSGSLTTIFEKYASYDKKKGTGLGLAIAKHIITAHGGKIWAESEPGAGSRFFFVLPS